MDEYTFKIVLTVISLLCTIVTGVLIPLIKERIGAEKLAKYEKWTVLAVQCAEMVFNEQGMGGNKKEYVVNFLNKMFNKKKVVITPEQIEVLIESAVKSMKLKEIKIEQII